MAHLTRDEVVERAESIFPKCGYVWGYYPGTNTPCHMDTAGRGVAGSGTLIATDCSGFTSWAWGLGGHVHSSYWSQSGSFGSGYHKRFAYTGTIETDFPGILPGDVLWKNGHVALYIGSNTTLEARTGQWTNTVLLTGMVRQTGARGDFLGYCSYDESYSRDRDDTPVPDWNPDGGENNPSDTPWRDDDDVYITYTALDNRYTRRYRNMKRWRRAK